MHIYTHTDIGPGIETQEFATQPLAAHNDNVGNLQTDVKEQNQALISRYEHLDDQFTR